MKVELISPPVTTGEAKRMQSDRKTSKSTQSATKNASEASGKLKEQGTAVDGAADATPQSVQTVAAKAQADRYVIPKEIKRYFLWKKWRESGVPIVNLVVAILALVIIFFQSKIYVQQREIMSAQTRVMEKSLRVSERAYVGVASITANLPREVVILFENIGHVPASNVKVEAIVARGTPSASNTLSVSGERVNDRLIGTNVPWEAGAVHLFPGTLRMRVAIPLKNFTPEEQDAILAKRVILYVGGTIRYEDGFGDVDTTTFAFKYSPPPDEGWTVDSGLSNVVGKD